MGLFGEVRNTGSVSDTSRTTAQTPVKGKLQGKTVTIGGDHTLTTPVDDHAENVLSNSANSTVREREVTQGVSQELVKQLSLGEIEKISNYLTNHVVKGDIPRDLLPDFEEAILYAKRADEEISRAAVLLGKSDDYESLSADEQAEVQALMGSSKYNLSLIQGWLMEKRIQLAENNQLSHVTDTLIQSLQQRFADRHMDAADLISLFDLDEMPPEAVSRSDRINSHLLQADAALMIARQLSVAGLAGPAKSAIIKILEEHQSTLSQAKTVSEYNVTTSKPPTELSLAAKEIWDTPFAMVSAKKGKKDSIAQLKAHWNDKAQNGSAAKKRWLPLAHAKVGQARMLQEFIRHQLLAAGVAKKDLPDLKFMFHQAHNQTLNRQPWDPIRKQVRYDLVSTDHLNSWPARGVAESSITPAKAFAQHFAQDYPLNGINCADRLQYQHVPNLAHTQASDENGQVLFSGLRHGVLDAYDLTGKNLQKLPDATLRSMISDLLVRDGAITPPEGNTRDEMINSIFGLIRNDPSSATEYANLMRVEASKNMAQEIAVAALVADPDKFQNALDGETVTLNLSSISLLTPDHLRPLIKGGSSSNERAMLETQTSALLGLSKDKPATLTVRDTQGNTQTVRANINVRTFNFGVNGGAVGRMMKIPSQTPVWRNFMGWGFAMDSNNPELAELVGPANNKEVSGHVRQKLDRMMAQKRQLQSDLTQMTGQSAVDRGRISESIARLDKDMGKLTYAASQLKEIWREGSFMAGDREPYKMVSRLALVAHLMGETPLFNCKSGKDRTGQLDAEVKCLAAFAEKNGYIPAPESQPPGLRRMRSQFTLGSGNLEMQRINTGLPGYKLKRSEVPGLANMVADEALEPIYRGGSDHIAA